MKPLELQRLDHVGFNLPWFTGVHPDSVRTRFEELKILFPEGIIDQDLIIIWVYLTNPYGIDICVVIGEKRNGDWSDFFSGHRLLARETPKNNKESSVF